MEARIRTSTFPAFRNPLGLDHRTVSNSFYARNPEKVRRSPSKSRGNAKTPVAGSMRLALIGASIAQRASGFDEVSFPVSFPRGRNGRLVARAVAKPLPTGFAREEIPSAYGSAPVRRLREVPQQNGRLGSPFAEPWAAPRRPRVGNQLACRLSASPVSRSGAPAHWCSVLWFLLGEKV